MQAYQSAPCPYCGATWNPPGAQTCTNCRNQLPPPQPTYAPPGYAPQPGGQPQQGQTQPPPGQGQGAYPYGPPPGYPAQAYPQAPASYPGAPPGYPSQQAGQQPYAVPGQGAYPDQPPQYPGYAPPGYGQAPQYPGSPYGANPSYPTGAAAPGTTSLHLFGRSFTLPVALPPVVVQYQQTIAYAAVGLLALLIVLFGILPAVASGQISAANQAITTAVSHQSKVDAGFASMFTPDSNATDLKVIKAQGTKIIQSIDGSLAIVQADESALNSVDGRLSILQWVALPSGGAITAERLRLKTALDSLKHADTGLTAGSNMGKVVLPTYDAMIDFTNMYTALGKHDLVGAAAPYPDAQAKLQQAISQDQLPGVPAAVAKQLTALSSLLDNTESLIQAIQSKDNAGIKKYSDAVQAGLKTLSADSLPADYEQKTYGSEQKAYDAAMKSLKA
jgi:hypothetical protein